MSNVVTHRFASAKSDGADATQIQPSHWNDGHKFIGGAAGDVLTRDPTDATYGAKWAPAGIPLVVSNNDTGTADNWAPAGLSASANGVILWGGSGNLLVSGFAGGVPGRVITLKNRGSGVVSFAFNSGSSGTGNKLFNFVSSGHTPVALDGIAQYIYLGAVGTGGWYLFAHEQGSWIVPPHVAGNYTAGAGSWTVDAGDVTSLAYRLSGKTLMVSYFLSTTSVSVSSPDLRIGIPGGYTASRLQQTIVHARNNGGTYAPSIARVNSGSVITLWSNADFGAWAASVNLTDVIGELFFDVN